MTFPDFFPIFFLGSPKNMTWHGLLKAFSGVPISREIPIPDFFQESGIIKNSHFPVPDLFTRDTTLQFEDGLYSDIADQDWGEELMRSTMTLRRFTKRPLWF